MKHVPHFRMRTRDAVEVYAARVLAHGDATHLRRLIPFDDGHFRAVFNRAFFTLGAGQTEPSKSQWNTLKKRFKRMDRSVFLFKEHGTTRCDPDQPDMDCYYIDFGFYPHDGP